MFTESDQCAPAGIERPQLAGDPTLTDIGRPVVVHHMGDRVSGELLKIDWKGRGGSVNLVLLHGIRVLWISLGLGDRIELFERRREERVEVAA